MKIVNAIKSSVSKSTRKLKANGPTIGIFVGFGCCAASTVIGVIHALRVEKIKQSYEDKIEDIKVEIESCYDEEGNVPAEKVEVVADLESDAKKLKIKCMIAILAGFVPSVLLLSSGGVCIFASHKTMAKRNAALGAAYAALDRGYREYQKRVEDKLGKDEATKVKFESKEEDAVEAYVARDRFAVDSKLGYSPYARLFDEVHENWSPNHRDNVIFLRLVYDAAQRALERDGYLFLNDVYEWLGYGKTEAGQRVGWVRSSKPEEQVGDGFVSFGVNPYDIEFSTDYGREAWVLDFNVADITSVVFDYVY